MQAHFNDSSAELSVGMAQADVIKRVMLIERACISVSIGFQSIQVDELLYMCVCVGVLHVHMCIAFIFGNRPQFAPIYLMNGAISHFPPLLLNYKIPMKY